MKLNRIFEYKDYKEFSLHHIKTLPNNGRGTLQRLAKHLDVHPTLVSQVFRGPKDLTSEQACKAAEFFGLNESESDFYLSLVEHERAGNQQLKRYWRKRIQTLSEEYQTVANRILPSHALTHEQRVEFYSSWQYSGVRLATSIEQLQTAEAISDRLGISVKRVRDILEFLLQSGLCVTNKNKVAMGPSRTHIPSDSPLSGLHHQNWRLKALEAHSNLRKQELFFTAPVSIAKKDRDQVRQILLKAVEEISKLIEKTESEELCCLNIDWFDVRALR